MKNELIRHLFNTNSIMTSSDGFLTKSGMKYFFETDIRNGITDRKNAETFTSLAYPLIRECVDCETLIVGIPETGTLIAMFLYAHRLKESSENFPVNILRSYPKEYQKDTTYTVLPVEKHQKMLVIEDDVVSGDTLMGYLAYLKKLCISNVSVISIIDRQEIIDGKSVKEKVEGLGYRYQYLIGLNDIINYARVTGTNFPIT